MDDYNKKVYDCQASIYILAELRKLRRGRAGGSGGQIPAPLGAGGSMGKFRPKLLDALRVQPCQ
jgi:hypothetical protein